MPTVDPFTTTYPTALRTASGCVPSAFTGGLNRYVEDQVSSRVAYLTVCDGSSIAVTKPSAAQDAPVASMCSRRVTLQSTSTVSLTVSPDSQRRSGSL